MGDYSGQLAPQKAAEFRAEATEQYLSELVSHLSLKQRLICGGLPGHRACPHSFCLSRPELLAMSREEAWRVLTEAEMDHSIPLSAICQRWKELRQAHTEGGGELVATWHVAMNRQRLLHELFSVHAKQSVYGTFQAGVVMRCKSCHDQWDEKKDATCSLGVASRFLPAIGWEPGPSSLELYEELESAVKPYGQLAGDSGTGATIISMTVVMQAASIADGLAEPFRNWRRLIIAERDRSPLTWVCRLSAEHAAVIEGLIREWLRNPGEWLQNLDESRWRVRTGPTQEVCGKNGCILPTPGGKPHSGLCQFPERGRRSSQGKRSSQ